MFLSENPVINKKKNFKFIAIIVAIFLLIIFIFGEPIFSVYSHSMNGKSFVEKAQNSLEQGDLKEASLNLTLAHQEFLKASQKMQRLHWYQGFPILGPQVLAIAGLMDTATELTGALSELAEVADTIFAPMNNSLSKSNGEEKGESLKALSLSTPLFQETKDKIDAAEKNLTNISEKGLLPQINSVIGLMKSKIPELKGVVDQLITVSRILPETLGYPEEKTYLFLFQNNMELRPAGGFIGTYGILKFKNGEITNFFTDDVYNLDKLYQSSIPTPEPFQIYNKRMEWYFRDSNWAPAFSEAAKKAEWFYHLEGGEEENLDGVIAISPSFIEKILELTGPIIVPGYPYEFNSENFSDQLEYHVEQNYTEFDKKENRKNIIGDFGEILLDHAVNLPKGKLLGLFNTILEGFKEKQALIYFNDQKLQKVAQNLNWSGDAIETPSDYLWYIDCNLASLKSDPFVKRSIDYSVNWDGQNNPIARFTMTYNHTGEFNWRTTRYRTYARLYVPQGSKLIKITGNESEIKTYEEYGKTVFSFFKVIEPQTTETVTLEYELPKNLASQTYTLYAQKQAGTFNYPLNVKVNWNGVSEEWKTDLTTDREIKLR